MKLWQKESLFFVNIHSDNDARCLTAKAGQIAEWSVQWSSSHSFAAIGGKCKSMQSDMDDVRSLTGLSRRIATLYNILSCRCLALMWEGWRRQKLTIYGRYGNAFDLLQQLTDGLAGLTAVSYITKHVLQVNCNFRQDIGYWTVLFVHL